ncbi:hypothetical protein GWK47_041909 [Chionoecetes opilio]|uniref:Uncharacterized protein n=1 Tax=Chionoecetes opilio TaxID=41210 RepID=A0A8J4YIL8_CHIOP|nr:hypothetical protein GWK47_041909 [Chionoecetes opilio]
MQYQSLKGQREASSRGSPTSGSLPGAAPMPPAPAATTAVPSSAGAAPTTAGAGAGAGAGASMPVGGPAGPGSGSPQGVGMAGAPPTRPLSVPIGAADVDAIRRERDFFKQQMEYFRQQLGQAGRAAPVVPGLGMAMDSDRASARGPLQRGSSDPSPPLESDPSVAAMRGDLRASQQERDFFRQQYENLKSSMSQPHPQASSLISIVYFFERGEKS